MSEVQPSETMNASPTAGVASEHSAYYRRLLSAGYKGHIQGGIGGATLYGAFGVVIGGLVGVGFAPFTGGASLWLIPALGGWGAIEGAKTFADIGSHAAIIADSAETNEKRRYLLDKLRDSRDPAEKEALTRELNEQLEPKSIKQFFHWKTAAIGAALGAVVALTGFVIFPYLGISLLPLTEMLVAHGVAQGSATALLATCGTAIGTAIGALSGAAIGVDREYVRRWLDTSESVVSEHNDIEAERIARARDLQMIRQLAEDPGYTRKQADTAAHEAAPAIAPSALAQNAISTIPLSVVPDKNIADVNHLGRAQAALQITHGQV